MKLVCPKCGKTWYANDDEYAESKNLDGHPYTCDCGDHVVLVPMKETPRCARCGGELEPGNEADLCADCSLDLSVEKAIAEAP